MKFIYLSTDEFEAEELLESCEPSQIPRHIYKDISVQRGSSISQKIGFSPMSAIIMDDSCSADELIRSAIKLSEHGLYVSTRDGRIARNYYPKDKEESEEMVKLSLQKQYDGREAVYDGYHLLIYSNKPKEIRNVW